MLFQLIEGARQIGYCNKWHIFRRAGSHFAHRGGQTSRLILRHNDGRDAGGIGRAQTSTQIVRVGDAGRKPAASGVACGFRLGSSRCYESRLASAIPPIDMAAGRVRRTGAERGAVG